jgi:hypothetical protein
MAPLDHTVALVTGASSAAANSAIKVIITPA